jgi:hypothetical protein
MDLFESIGIDNSIEHIRPPIISHPFVFSEENLKILKSPPMSKGSF